MNKTCKNILSAIMTMAVCCIGASAGETNALPPLPRLPPLPSGSSAQVQELDGAWEFNPAPKARSGEWKPIQVPGQWLQQGFTKTEPEVVYRRRVALPSDWQGQRIKLRFDTVYSESVVLFNGQKLGEHKAAYTPFECDATAAVRFGSDDNLLEVRVRNTDTAANKALSGNSYAGHDLGGIVRGVRIFPVPPVNIASFHVRTELDLATGQARLLVDLKVANEGAVACVPAPLRLTLIDPAGKPVALEPVAPALKELAPGAVEAATLSFPVSQPLLWEAEHPHLYTLTAGLGSQTATRRVGFRSITMKEGQVLVNGRVVKLAGVCRWDTHYLRGRSLPAGLGREDVRLFKEANINFLRTSHCPPMEEVLEACDELGMYVLDEAPACWYAPNPKGPNDLDVAKEAAIVAGTLDMLERDRSHPSVIAWSLSNESGWQTIFQTTAAMVKHYDPTRPRLISGDWSTKKGFAMGLVDIPNTPHYPSPSRILGEFASMRPALFTEYAHVGRTNQREKISDPGVLDLYGEDLAEAWAAVLEAHHIGGAIWCGVDEYFRLPDDRVVGWGRWGILDEFRRPKPEYWHVKKVYSPIQITARTLIPGADGSLRIPVANRYVFTDLEELNWSCVEGAVEAAVPPGATGELLIRPRSAGAHRITLEAHHPAGWLVDAFSFDLAPAAPSVPPARAEAAPKLEEQTDRWVISAGPDQWTVDRQTGLIVQGRRKGTTLITGGPHLVATLPEDPNHQMVMDPKKILPLPAVVSPAVKSAAVREEGGRVIVDRIVDDEALSGVIRLSIAGDGSLTAEYDLKWKPSTDKEQADRALRELGLAFDVAPACDRLSWRRTGQWSYYPEDHIGREIGSCRAFPSGQRPAAFSYTPQNPKLPWSQDETPWGCNDFRSTKHNICEAALSSPEGAGVRVVSNGRQHVRVTVEDERTLRLFVNDFSGIGLRTLRGKFPFGYGYLNLAEHPEQKGQARIELVDNQDKDAVKKEDPKGKGKLP